MKKEKYVFNHQTLQYEKHSLTLKNRFLKVFGFFSAVVFSATILFVFSYFYLPSPKEKALLREFQQMEFYYSNLSEEYNDLSHRIDELYKKDGDLHRVIFGQNPIDEAVWNGGVGGHDKNLFVTDFKRTGEFLNTTLDHSERLKRKIKLQTQSFNSLYELAKEREVKLASLPSIKPVREDKLKRKIGYLSGFGWRIHPVFKIKKFHKGIDFTAPVGTPIQATGNGIIKRVEKKKRGYGYNVIIDHGYGYESLYAHMKTISVKKGQTVTKGEQIGTVGNTGTSTAPHCHYEVHLNGNAINPIDYCMDGLTPKEYQELVKRAKEENQSFD